MKKIIVNNIEYEVIKDYNNALNLEDLTEKFTDYFEPFDYVVGDYSYEKLRLKGFLDQHNKNVKEYNNYKNVEEYIEKYCSYKARHFIIKKLKKDK